MIQTFLLSLLDPKFLVSFFVALTGLIAGVRALLISRGAERRSESAEKRLDTSAKQDWVSGIETSLRKQIDFLDGRVTKLQSDLSIALLLSGQLKDRVTDLQSELESAGAEIERLRGRVSELELDVVAKDKRIVELETAAGALRKRVAELELDVAAKSKRIGELEHANGQEERED